MISVLHTLHTWGRILVAAGGVLGVLVAVPAIRLGGVWKTWLRIAAFVLILGLSMLLEEQVLSSAGLSHVVKQPSLAGDVDESFLTSRALPNPLTRSGAGFLAETLVRRPERGYYPARRKIC